MPHWTYYLPEVGTPITRRGDELDALFNEAQRLRDELARINAQLEVGERAIMSDVSKNWTMADIGKAKMDRIREGLAS